MSASNNCHLIGRLGSDPEVRYFDRAGSPNSQAVASFRLAVNRMKKDAPADWFTVKIFGRQAELAQELLAKGRQVAVVGRVEIDEWEDRDGNKRLTVVLQADGFQVLGSREDGATGAQPSGNGQQRQRYQRQFPDTPDDDDIPPF